MDRNEISNDDNDNISNDDSDNDTFDLYDSLIDTVNDKRKKKIQIIKNERLLRYTLSNLDKEQSEKVYYLLLHHYLKSEGLDAKQLIGRKITFYGQKVMFGNKGVMFTCVDDQLIKEILYEFLQL
jgi:hypothetical protein